MYELVNQARQNYDSLNVDGMQYYANRSGTNFNAAAKSIGQILANYFDGYTLFLDEFKGHEYAIFIRNLARAVGIRCCVSNTNAKVANLVGKHQSIMSGYSAESVWSIVVTELKLSNYQTTAEERNF